MLASSSWLSNSRWLRRRSISSSEADGAIPAQQVFFEDGVHRFQRQSKIGLPPRPPTARLVFKNAIVEPFAFDFSLNSKLLDLLKWKRRLMPGVKKDYGGSKFIDEI